MLARRQRLVLAGWAIGIAIVSLIVMAQGFIAVGVLGFVLLVVLISWRTRSAQTADSPAFALARPALAPPDGHVRFTVVVEDPAPARVAEVWSDLCRPEREHTESFRRLFQDFTVLDGSRFRFRKGDPNATAALLAEVLSAAAGAPVRTSLEPAAERTPIWS